MLNLLYLFIGLGLGSIIGYLYFYYRAHSTTSDFNLKLKVGPVSQKGV